MPLGWLIPWDSIADDLKEENVKLQEKDKNPENKLSDIEIVENKLQQYPRRKNRNSGHSVNCF